MPRPGLTLVYISRQTVARADFASARKPAPIGFWDRHRPESPELGVAVEIALSLGPTPVRSVWVLTTDIWTQTLALPNANAANLKPSELAQALGFEAESLSGIPAVEGETGAVPLPPSRGERPNWLVQLRTFDRDAADAAVRRAGGTLAGILHPGGLPRSLGPDADAAFRRVELWPDAALGVRRSAEGTLDIRVVNSDPPLGRWASDLNAWFGGEPSGAESLVAEGFSAPPGPDGKSLRLDTPEALPAFLECWAQELGRRPARVPLIAPPVHVMSDGKRVLLALGLTALSAGLCAGSWYFLDREQKESNALIAKSRPDGKTAEEVKKAVAARTTERDKLKADRVRLESSVARLEQYKTRYARLLDVAAAHKPDGSLLVVQRVEQDGPNPKVIGVTLRPKYAHEYSRSLSAALRPHGWEVQPAKEKAMNKFDDGGPWEFEFVIRDAIPAPPPTPAQPTKRN